MAISYGRCLLPFLLLPLFLEPCVAQCIVDDLDKIVASDGDSSDAFGKSVAMSGDRAVVGAKGDEGPGGTPGSAYFLQRIGDSWFEIQKVFASDATNLDNFGWSVAMDGDRVVIGAPFSGVGGAAYVFEHNGVLFQETHKLIPTMPSESELFGWSVALHGDVVIVGAPSNGDTGNDKGVAYVFDVTDTSWTQEAKLMASDGEDFSKFGYAVTAGASQVAIGAPFRVMGATPDPAVYLYEDIGSTWGNEVKLINFEEAADWFGGALAMDGERLIVGASHDATNGIDAGAVFLFEGSGAAWNLTDKLAGGSVAGDVLGNEVAISGDTIIAGALAHIINGDVVGGAYLFRHVGGIWVDTMIYPPDPVHLAFFGSSVAISGDYALSSATGDSTLGTGAGAVYVYEVPDLVLAVNDPIIQVGNTLSFTVCGGPPGNPLSFWVMGINGSPFILRLLSGSFDAQGTWSFSADAPLDLANNSITFACFALNEQNKVVVTPEVTVMFLP